MTKTLACFCLNSNVFCKLCNMHKNYYHLYYLSSVFLYLIALTAIFLE